MKVQSNYIKTLTATNSIKDAVNRQKTMVKSIVARPIAVTHIQFDSHFVINENQINAIDDGALRNIITAYWTARYGGVTPTATTVNSYIQKFKEYIETATRMVGRFLCLKKCQDQWNLDNDDYGQIGMVFTNPKDVNIGELSAMLVNTNSAEVTLESKVNSPLVGTVTVFGDFTLAANAINSAAWTRNYTTPLKNVYLPIDVLNMLNLIFGATIELTSDDDETVRYIQFWQPATAGGNFPDSSYDTSVANFKKAYDADYAQIQSILSEYPMLKDILVSMNYVSALDCVNTRRDLAGKTLKVVRDRNDVLEFAIRSVLLSQQDAGNVNDILTNSVLIEAKKAYLDEVIFTTPFNVVVTNLYNVENFIRGKIFALCVSALTIVKNGGSSNVSRIISCSCADNLAVWGDGRTNADWTRLILATVDGVEEMDAVTACIMHNIEIHSNNTITVKESYVEASAKTFQMPEGDVGNLLFCVNSGFYIDQPEALAKLTKDTLYSVEAGVSTAVSFGEDKNSKMGKTGDKSKKKPFNKRKKAGKPADDKEGQFEDKEEPEYK